MFSTNSPFLFDNPAPPKTYTLSLHDALPISAQPGELHGEQPEDAEAEHGDGVADLDARVVDRLDRKSTRLNSSHGYISYAVFCLKKKSDDDTMLLSNRKLFRHIGITIRQAHK